MRRLWRGWLFEGMNQSQKPHTQERRMGHPAAGVQLDELPVLIGKRDLVPQGEER